MSPSNQFRPDELVNHKGQVFPKVGGRLRVQHENHEHLSIETEMVTYEHLSLAICKAKVTTNQGVFTANGVASAEKDQRLITSLLELAETRSIARALRFSGAGVEFTGSEELPTEPQEDKIGRRSNISTAPTVEYATTAQVNAILAICNSYGWNPLEATRRIIKSIELNDLSRLTKKQACVVISRMKEVKVA
jgi:hypothetical protein